MINGTITLKHKTTGRLHYTFEHWPDQWIDEIECLSVTSRLPDNNTSLVDWIPIEDLEVV